MPSEQRAALFNIKNGPEHKRMFRLQHEYAVPLQILFGRTFMCRCWFLLLRENGAKLFNVLQHDSDTKSNDLHLQGYFDDKVGNFESIANSGYEERRELFLADQDGNFRTDPVRFIGKLNTCFQGVTKREYFQAH